MLVNVRIGLRVPLLSLVGLGLFLIERMCASVAGLWRSVSHAPCVDQHDKPVALIMAPESKLLVAAMLVWGGDGRSNLVSAPASNVLRIGESRCYHTLQRLGCIGIDGGGRVDASCAGP